jgi:hypothetical protein
LAQRERALKVHDLVVAHHLEADHVEIGTQARDDLGPRQRRGAEGLAVAATAGAEDQQQPHLAGAARLLKIRPQIQQALLEPRRMGPLNGLGSGPWLCSEGDSHRREADDDRKNECGNAEQAVSIKSIHGPPRELQLHACVPGRQARRERYPSIHRSP